VKRYLIPTRLDRTATAPPVDVTGRSERNVDLSAAGNSVLASIGSGIPNDGGDP
jgi:hypothetical protein